MRAIFHVADTCALLLITEHSVHVVADNFIKSKVKYLCETSKAISLISWFLVLPQDIVFRAVFSSYVRILSSP
jgi:hypothetical protein